MYSCDYYYHHHHYRHRHHDILLPLLQRVSIACYAERCASYNKSVRLSVRHTLALCQNDSSYDHAVFTVGYQALLISQLNKLLA